MKTNKTKFLTKIISCFLCTAITLQVGLTLTGEKVNAVTNTVDHCTVNVEGSLVTCTTNTSDNDNLYDFNILDNNGPKIYSNELALDQYYLCDVGENYSYVMNPNTYLRIYTDISLYNVELKGTRMLAAALIIKQEGVTVTINGKIKGSSGNSSTNSTNYIENSGILVMDSLDCSADLENNGNIIFFNRSSGVLEVNDMIFDSENFRCDNGSKIRVANSFAINNDTINSTVVAKPNTKISTSGSNFTLRVEYDDDTFAEKEITSEISCTDKPAEELLDDPTITWDSIDNIPYGEDYYRDLRGKVRRATGYTGSILLQYSKDKEKILPLQPIASGEYYVRAYAYANGSFRRVITDWEPFVIDTVPFETLFPSGAPYCTTNVVNGKYVQGKFLILTSSEELGIGSTTIPEAYTIPNPLYISDETIHDVVLNDNGEVNADISIYFVGGDYSDYPGAKTDKITLDKVCPEIENLVFDYYDPTIILESVDGNSAEPYEDDEVEALTIPCDYVTIGVSEANLDKIYVNDKLYEDGEKVEDGYYRLKLKSVADKYTDYSIKVTDLSGRESTYSISLYPPPGDPILTIKVPSDPIYVDDDYEITAGSHSDKTPSIDYYTDEEEPLDEKPTEAGDYIAVASVAESEFYNAGVKSAPFSILKRTTSLSVSVPDIYVDGTVSPAITGVPEDYDEELIVEYKSSKAADSEYTETVPEGAGEYTVRITLPETRKYKEATDTATFTISKYKIESASVTVADILVGQTPSPVITGVPEDYEGKPAITYKSGTGAVVKDGDAFAAGTYTVSVVFPATDKYAGASCSDSFTVAQDKFTPSVSVADITVGQTPNPLVKGVPSDYDGTVTCEYKLSSAADTAYSSATPEK
ncbi:MAG: hypothetical protein IKE94_13140, partial [Aeriscardovia sp.]|nr:hypothetical protein [Aeriscardovia sp.]